MSKILRWPLWLLEAIPFFLAMGVFRLLGVDGASAAGGWLARTLAPLSPAHGTAKRNLKRAFPQKGEAEIAAILKGMWDNLGRTFAEYPHFRAFSGYPNARIALEGLGVAEAAKAAGKGVIALSGHCANWELMALTAHQCGMHGAEIYRPINNPLVNAWIVRQRSRYAYPLQISKLGGQGARDMLRTLKSGGTIAMLTDQKHREGVAIPFFGRDAMTVTGPAVLSLRTGAALVPVTMVRTTGARFAMEFHAPLQIARTGEKEADIRAVLTAISQALEEAIRAHPEQWLWAHNRWMDKA